MGNGLVGFIERIAESQGYYSGESLPLLQYGTEVELILPVRLPRTNSYLELCFVRGVVGLWHVRSNCAIAPKDIDSLGKRSPNEYAPAILVNPKLELCFDTPGRLYMCNLPDLTFWRYAADSVLSQPKIMPYKQS